MDNGDIANIENEVNRIILSAIRGSLKLMILRILSDKDFHGYELIKEIEKRTLGLWRPVPGSIYPALKALESKGFIKSYNIIEKGKTKKYYKITNKGMILLKMLDDKLHAIRSYIISSLPRSKEILRRYDINELQELLKRLSEWRNILDEVIKIIEVEIREREARSTIY